jgi:hypothetical protein
MEVKAKESMEKQLMMAVVNYEKVAKAKSQPVKIQSGTNNAMFWNQRFISFNFVNFVIYIFLF